MANDSQYTTHLKIDMSDFKKGIDAAKSSIVGAQAEFKKADSALKLYGKSTESVSSVIDALKKKLNGQNDALELLKKEYERVASAEGETSEAALKLKNQILSQETGINNTTKTLNKMESELQSVGKAEKMAAQNGLTVEQNLKIMSDAEKQAAKEAEDAAAELMGMGKAAQDSADDAKQASNGGFTVLKGVIANLATEVIKSAIDGLKNLSSEMSAVVTEAAAYADEINTMSMTTGIATDKLQEMQYMSDFLDVSVETITGSMTKLEKNMYSAQQGSASMQEKFKALGVSVTDANGELRDNEDVFNDVISALGKIDNETEREAVAMNILGKSAKDLNPLIAAGGDEIARLTQEAHDMGYVLSDEALTAANDLNDTFDRTQAVAEGVKNQFGAMLAPIVNEFLTPFAEMIASLPAAMEENGISGVVGVFSAMLTNALTYLNTNAPMLASAGVELIVAITNGMLENLPLALSAATLIILELTKGLGEALPDLIPAVTDIMLEIVDVLIDNIDMLTDATIAIITGLSDGFIRALPKLLAKAPEIIKELTDALNKNAPQLIEAATEIIIQLSTFLTQPEIIEMLLQTAVSLIVAIVNTLITNAPLLAGAAIQILTALAAGLRDADQILTDKARELIEEFKKKFEATKDLVIAMGKFLIEKIAEGLKNSVSSAKQWATDMVNGFIQGIKDRAANLGKAVKENISNTIAKYIHFSVPDAGALADADTWMPDMMSLFVKGIDQNKQKLVTAVNGVTAAMKNALAPQLDGMGNIALSVNGGNGGIYGGGSSTKEIVNNYNFVQNNNSPKALSRLDIYRQTKNQISMARRAGAYA